jgi:hypothetical protein
MIVVVLGAIMPKGIFALVPEETIFFEGTTHIFFFGFFVFVILVFLNFLELWTHPDMSNLGD